MYYLGGKPGRRISISKLVARFWAKVNKNGGIPEHMPHLGECWISSAFELRSILTRKRINPFRFSWELHFGAIPDGLFVCHKCDRGGVYGLPGGCVNPTHLFLGTNKDNMHDASVKGRCRTDPYKVWETRRHRYGPTGRRQSHNP